MAETECAVVSYSKSGWLTSEWVDAVDKVGDEVVNALICVLWMDWSPLQSAERRDCSRD